MNIRNASAANPIGPDETSETVIENCLPRGTRLADFEIMGVIGEGGFGIVYFAFDRSLRRTVAIKEYMPGAFAGRGPDKRVVVRSQRHQETFTIGLKSFINEARLLAQFDHPALIKVYRYWQQNNTGYMAMRYYEGRTLKSVVNNNPAQVTEAWLKSMLKPMLEALDAMYRVQILHRDISPDNIMIQKNGEAVLLDFGAARQIIGDMTHSSLTVILKPGYAPIEQYADDSTMKQGPWTDIYSLSAVVYFAIMKMSPPTSVARMVNDPIKRLQDGGHSGFSKEFLAAIDMGLSLKPEDRPQSIEEFRKLLDLELSVPMPTPDSSTGMPRLPESRSRKERDGSDKPRASASTKTPDGKRLRQDSRKSKQPEKPKRSPALWIAAVAGLCVLGASGYFLFKHRPAPVAAASVVAAHSPAHAVTPAPVPAPSPAPVSSAPSTGAASAAPVPDDESFTWEVLKDNPNATPQEFEQFIQKYPAGQHVEQARASLLAMQTKADREKAATSSGANATPAPAAAAGNAKTANATGTVTLTIKPWGNVMVDGVLKGVSPPLKKLVLPEGKHRIKVVNPNFPDHVTEIDVSKKKTRNISYDFSPSKN
ncbi:serine/threonine protein kinase [Paraherbaspirillum soli]|uniref:non-specific serine/threonine protein kinase n=1 Tax=Paraherbaspirillum soli TaxID=631222 RepID=A0ABW0M667_9BURK